MKKTGGWPRKKRLQAKTELKPGSSALSRRTPLTSSRSLEAGKGLKRSELVSKRPTVTPEERRAHRIVKARPADGLCERCGRRPGTDYCHRVGAAQGGAYCPTNAWWGCRSCHRDCHLNPTIAYEQGWHLKRHQHPATEPIWLAGLGRVLLRPDGTTVPYGKAA